MAAEHVENKRNYKPWPTAAPVTSFQVKRTALLATSEEGRRRSPVIAFRPTTRAETRQPRSVYQETD